MNPIVIIKTAAHAQTVLDRLRRMRGELPASISVAARPTRPAISAKRHPSPVVSHLPDSAFGVRHSEFHP